MLLKRIFLLLKSVKVLPRDVSTDTIVGIRTGPKKISGSCPTTDYPIKRYALANKNSQIVSLWYSCFSKLGYILFSAATKQLQILMCFRARKWEPPTSGIRTHIFHLKWCTTTRAIITAIWTRTLLVRVLLVRFVCRIGTSQIKKIVIRFFLKEVPQSLEKVERKGKFLMKTKEKKCFNPSDNEDIIYQKLQKLIWCGERIS